LTLQVYQNKSIWFTRTFQVRSQAPLGAVGDLSEQALFLLFEYSYYWHCRIFKTSNFVLHTPCRCGHRWSVSFSCQKKKWFKHLL